MAKKQLPESLRRFVAKQTTVPVEKVWKSDPQEARSPYGSCWYRAVACMLLSGRVHPKADGSPNRTEVNRLCKEANFNQYLFDRIARFLVAAEVINADRRDTYSAGSKMAGFLEHDPKKLQALTRAGLLRSVRGHTGSLPWRPTMVWHAHLIEFLALFFTCFKGRALRESEVGKVLHDFCLLPRQDLLAVARDVGLKATDVNTHEWEYWLDEKGRKALVAALYEAEWAYYAEVGKTDWFFPSPIGLGMLGLGPTPPAPELPVIFKALPNLCIFAGSGLGLETLVPLFRYTTIKRIDQVFEFQLNRKRLAEAPSGTSPGEELRQVLKELEPLPATIASLLDTKSKLGGVIGIRWCSALLKPATAEVLSAIREHPQLKGFLEPAAPPGYLLIKARSNPNTFVRRCQALGFEVKML